ncbi:MAG: ABC transporter substrate-binding protein [Candidatus Bipolaricaulota bacterium]|nr:ABC transporter substrate-binding protein [Candidatus Bipolaricaulota bacterium]
MTRYLLAAALLAFPALGGPVVVDQAGRRVELPSRVERVVDLHGGAKWVLYALGGADLLVGAYFVNLPADPLAQDALRGVDPRYADKALPIRPSVEALLALKPDLVFGSSVVHGAAFADLLAEVGIPVVLLYPETLELLIESVRLIGQAVGREGRAADLAAFLQGTIERVRATAGRAEVRPTVYFSAFYPLNVYAGDVIQNVITELAGGIPIGKGFSPTRAGTFWYRASAEQVARWDPEVILVPAYSRSSVGEVLADPVFGATRAARAGRVHRVPALFSPWDTPSPEVVLGLLWLAEVLHPGSTGLDLAAEVVRFYTAFYGVELPPEAVAGLLGK